MLPIGKLASTILKDVMVINYLSLLKLGLYIGYFCFVVIVSVSCFYDLMRVCFCS